MTLSAGYFIVSSISMPRVINTYIFKEISVPFLLSIAILTVTALLSKIIKLVELIVTHGIGPSFVFWFIVSIIPSFLIYTIPISYLIGVLVAFTRMSSDSEVTAMKASGLSLFNIMKPVITLAVVAYALTLACTLYLFPWGNINLKRLLFDAAKTRLISGIEEKTFYDRFKGAVLYVDHFSPRTGEMEGIFISQESGGAEPNTFFAQRGVFEPSEEKFSVYLKLFNGTVHRRTGENDPTYHIADFQTYALELSLSGGEPSTAAQRPNRELYPREMIGRVRAIRARGENTAPYLIDLHKRFALPASVFVFSLLGVPFGIQKIRSARFTGFTIALGLVLTYYVLSTAFEALGDNRVINPVFSVWGADIIFGAAGFYLFYRSARDSAIDLTSWIGDLGHLFKRRPRK